MSSKFFQKNLDLWAHRDPKMAVLLPYHECPELSFCKSKNSELNLRKISGKKFEYYHSQQNPLAEAKKWFASLKLDQVKVLYVYGVGLGYPYRAAQKWLKGSADRAIVFLEDDLGVIKSLLETENGSQILTDPQAHLYYFQDLQRSKDVFEKLYWNFIMTPISVTALDYYAKTKGEMFIQLHHKIFYDAAIKNALLDEYLQYGVAFFRNFYPNMLAMEGSYLGNNLFGKFKNIPAIICGAGPSLNKQLSLLHTLADKAIIFAGGSALNALNAVDFQPHFGGGIDPNSPQEERLRNNQAFEVPFFYRNRMFFGAFKLIHGPRLYIPGSGGYDIAAWFEENLGMHVPHIEEGHNVVNFHLEIAHAMGCNPIIFVGMDLAFTGMKSYAKGVIDETSVNKNEILNPENFDDTALIKPDVYGNPIYTLWKWVAESDWIGEYAKTFPELTIVNGTEGGLGFPDVPNIPFKEAVHQYLHRSYDLKSRIHGEIVSSPLPEVRKDKVVQLMEELKASLKRSIDHLQILVEESESVKQKLKKQKQDLANLQTGRAALSEIELSEEPAYNYVLKMFNTAYSFVLNPQFAKLKANVERIPQKKLMVQQLDLGIKRFLFLKEAAKSNLQILQLALDNQL